jgi:hypothetical protein
VEKPIQMLIMGETRTVASQLVAIWSALEVQLSAGKANCSLLSRFQVQRLSMLLLWRLGKKSSGCVSLVCLVSASVASPPLQLHADFRLNTDTGATAHMTPHRHWLRDYKPYVVPIKLANGGVVYSEGVGSLRFKPRVNGVELGSVQFSTSPGCTSGYL